MLGIGTTWIAPLVGDCLWQATACLLAGGLASFLWSRRAARAHRVLALAMLACLAAPALSQVVRHLGWGLLASETPPAGPSAGRERPMPAPADPPLAYTRSDLLRPATRDDRMLPATPGGPPAPNAAVPGSAGTTTAGRPDRQPEPRFNWLGLLAGLWALATILATTRLVLGYVLGRRLCAHGRPADNPAVRQALQRASRDLGLRENPRLHATDHVRCPMIWCWARQATILLPAPVAAGARIDWEGIFCHELAHLKRRDHIWSLLAEVLTCLLPWNPLAWWARNRLSRLSDQACDDWALAAGQSPTDYARSLVELVPDRPGALAMATVSSRKGLVGRVQRILSDRRCLPTTGLHWACAAMLAAVGLAAGIALAQARPAGPAEPREDAKRQIQMETETPAEDAPGALSTTAAGEVMPPERAVVIEPNLFWRSSNWAGVREIPRRSLRTSADPARGLRCWSRTACTCGSTTSLCPLIRDATL